MEEIDKASIGESVDHQVPDIIRSMWKYFEVALGVGLIEVGTRKGVSRSQAEAFSVQIVLPNHI